MRSLSLLFLIPFAHNLYQLFNIFKITVWLGVHMLYGSPAGFEMECKRGVGML